MPDLVIVYKRRSGPNEVSIMNVIGEVKGKTCIIVDDLVDTGGTLTKVADVIKEKGATKVQSLAYVHPQDLWIG
ncbi:MAG: hypothetical protein LBD57_05550 [Endomicrobium sp.]|jgi:ribose-phosphate pyrophosphokinase|uniref:phosphoribosyltransferase family protein n=1 Tax=Candidatus Endomicrobiellum cubanum TaxID=3242325 RepID=UPI00283528E9|nr:hypothetical protein [Endomicrobium sp.]